ncbi:MAG: hypothetical protein RR891_02175 [Clostridium sp.]|uniref:hypothetical protein n=1 Tax=Clostridium sp. TaxID=1506 RepID=UPI00304743CD
MINKSITSYLKLKWFEQYVIIAMVAIITMYISSFLKNLEKPWRIFIVWMIINSTLILLTNAYTLIKNRK